MRKTLSTLMVLAALTGCATDSAYRSPYPQSNPYAQSNLYPQSNAYAQNNPYGQYNAIYGVIFSVEPVAINNNPSGVGAVGGAVVGGVVGNQIGKGNGRKLATILGVLGGGVAGNEVERRMNPQMGVSMQIRLDNGQMLNVVQQDMGFRSGTRVRLTQQGNGQWVASY